MVDACRTVADPRPPGTVLCIHLPPVRGHGAGAVGAARARVDGGAEVNAAEPVLGFNDRIDEEDDVHFAHARGFVAKTSATEKERLKELLRAAWV